MSITQITTHVADARARLAQQFQGKANLQKLLDIFSARQQTLEDVFWALIDGRALATATGAALDWIGEMVGAPDRLGRSDDTYRSIIRAEILINTSHGDAESVYAYLRQIGATYALQRDKGNATLLVQFGGDDILVDGADLRTALERATASVTINIIRRAPSPFFGFRGNPGASGFGVGKLGRAL